MTTFGYTVLDAATTDEALLAAKRHGGPIDLVLTDVVMPETSGAEIAVMLKKLWPGVQVVYLSGYADGTKLRQALDTAEISFLHKPFTPMELANRVREVLGPGRPRIP